jgi:hypothetical protein
MQFGQLRPFEFAALASGNGAELRALVLGVEPLHGRHRFRSAKAQIFRPHDADVEAQVVARHVGGAPKHLSEICQHLLQWPSFCQRLGRADAVYLLGIERDVEPIGPHDHVARLQHSPFGIMQLPRQLHQSGPVVRIGQWRIVILGEAGGLGVVNEVHGT